MNEPQTQIYEFGEFRVDAAKRLLIKGIDKVVPLTPKVFDTLLYLVKNCGKVIEKDELMREIWTDSIVEENNLSQNISILRRIFGEKPGEHRFIVTVPGHGYRFVPEVAESNPKFEVQSSRLAEVIEESSKSETQISKLPEVENLITKNQTKNTSKLIAFGVLSVLVIGAFVFYFWRGDKKTVDAPIKSIAILPFKPLVAENRNEALELGMADTLISKLSGGEVILVRPLSAIRRYNSVEQDSLAAGRELGVESVLEGTIQNWGDRIRISAKLLRTSDGKQLWTEKFDEKFTDIFAVQDSISERVAAALKIHLGSREKKRPTENVEAYEFYMKGRYHISKLTIAEIKTSLPYFEQAITADPNYALAYTGLANTYRVLAISGEMPPTEVFPKAKTAEQKAIEIDDSLADAHDSLCSTLFWFDWDWKAAENECRRAIELDPNNADSHGSYAHLLSNIGRHDEALAEAKRSLELNPLSLPMNALTGQFLIHAGKNDEALAQLQKTSELEPNFWMPHFFAASAYIEKGMYAEAITESNKEKELSGGNVIPFGAYALSKSGKRDEANAVLDELLNLSKTKFVPPYNIALIYNGLGETEKSLEWLEKAFEQRDPKMVFLKVEPKWNNLRREPRFIELMRRMNFE